QVQEHRSQHAAEEGVTRQQTAFQDEELQSNRSRAEGDSRIGLEQDSRRPLCAFGPPSEGPGTGKPANGAAGFSLTSPRVRGRMGATTRSYRVARSGEAEFLY